MQAKVEVSVVGFRCPVFVRFSELSPTPVVRRCSHALPAPSPPVWASETCLATARVSVRPPCNESIAAPASAAVPRNVLCSNLKGPHTGSTQANCVCATGTARRRAQSRRPRRSPPHSSPCCPRLVVLACPPLLGDSLGDSRSWFGDTRGPDTHTQQQTPSISLGAASPTEALLACVFAPRGGETPP